MYAIVAAVLCILSGLAAQVPDVSSSPQAPFEMAPGVTYDPAIPTLDQVTGHAWGTEISAHRDVESYIHALAAAAPTPSPSAAQASCRALRGLAWRARSDALWAYLTCFDDGPWRNRAPRLQR